MAPSPKKQKEAWKKVGQTTTLTTELETSAIGNTELEIQLSIDKHRSHKQTHHPTGAKIVKRKRLPGRLRKLAPKL